MREISLLELDTFLQRIIYNIPVHLPEQKACFEQLYYTGCRAREVVNRLLWTFNSNGKIELQTLKGGGIRYFNYSQVSETWLQLINQPDAYDRFITYRKLQYTFSNLIAKYGIEIGDKSSLLHLFRHNYIKKMYQLYADESHVKTLIAHKDLQMTRNYIYSKIYATAPLI